MPTPPRPSRTGRRQDPLPVTLSPVHRGACPSAHTLFLYATGALTAAPRTDLRVHLLRCAACQAEHREIADAPHHLAAMEASPLSRLRALWGWLAEAAGRVELALPVLEAGPALRGAAGALAVEEPLPSALDYRAGDTLISLQLTRDPDVARWELGVVVSPSAGGTLRLMDGDRLVGEGELAPTALLEEVPAGAYVLDLDLGTRRLAVVLPVLP